MSWGFYDVDDVKKDTVVYDLDELFFVAPIGSAHIFLADAELCFNRSDLLLISSQSST